MNLFTPLDIEIRKEIEENLDQTLVVAAGAGTGKTTLLTRRYVALLKNKNVAPSEIVAITFTKKAAAELRERIRNEMVKQGFSDLLLQFETAPIGTIHSFCAAVLKQYAVEAGIDPHFEQMESIEQYEFLTRSFRSWFSKHVIESTAYQDFTNTGFGFAKVQQLAIELYHFRDLVDQIEFEYRPVTAERIRDFANLAESIHAFARDCCKDMTDEGYIAIHQIRKSSVPLKDISIRDACKLILREPQIPKKLGRQTSWNTKDQAKDFKSRMDALRNELSLLQKDFSIELLAKLVDWLRGYLRFLEIEKRNESFLDFDDLLLLTRDLLRSKPSVLQSLQKQYQYFLIDEFQDTDPIQAEIFWMLSRTTATSSKFGYDLDLVSGKLFTVGDINQSIYRFRNASVETYERCIESLQVRGKLLRITQNFRSNPHLLTTLNSFFTGFLSERFFTLATLPHESWDGRAIHVLKQNEDVSLKQMRRTHEATSIACHIRHLIDSKHQIFDYAAQKMRNLTYADIAILFPVSTKLDLYEFALKKAGIPFSLYRSGSFFQTLEVRSIMQIMAAIIHPYDELKVVEALSSMFFGYSYDDLAHFKKINQSFDYRSANIAELPSQLRKQIEILQTLQRTFIHFTPSQWIEKIIESIHAMENVQSKFNVDQVRQNVRKVVWMSQDYESSQGGNVIEFESWLQDLSQHSDEISEAHVTTQPNAVQIMTVHQSKGLEFQVVFVANLASEIRTSKTFVANRFYQTLDFRIGDKDSFLKTRNFDASFEKENAFITDEKRRLMYVGLTRAKNILVLPSPTEKDKKSYMELLGPIFDQNSSFDLFSYKNIEPYPTNDRGTLKYTSAEMDRSFLSTIPKGYERVTATEQKETVVSSLPNTYSFMRRPKLGIAFHAYVERHDVLHHSVNEELLNQICIELNLEDAGKEFRELVEIFIRSDLFRRIQKAKNVYREIPFSFFDNQVLYEGYIDMILEESQGLTIIDLKTDKLTSKDLPERSRIYEQQLKIYSQAIQKATSESVHETILYFVRLNTTVSIA